MSWLAQQPNTMFLGQAVRYGGTGLFDTLTDVPRDRCWEWPVAENFQIGASIGLAMSGLVPVTLIPRWNFLLCATDQIINHLDKLPLMSDGRCRPRVIVRVAVGSETPVDPQQQHKGNFSQAFRTMCQTIHIQELHHPQDILPAYQTAYHDPQRCGTILVEFPDYGK